ncbi:MAG: YegS/Rv2252/BmrU family lipid kinase [Actinomycetia bacterium]|nr:YegS/Rv2252/BmrU family lipid kinase [Actinomycetes bacterium]
MPATRVIINPNAQHGVTSRLIDAVRGLFAETDAEVVVTEAPRHATELARESAGISRVIAVGGDGTISEVINGLMGIEQDARPALGIIPSGSGNDIARLCGIPTGLSRAFPVLQNGVPRSFDVGICNDRFFFSSFSVGLDALVVAKTIEYKERPHGSGLALYVRALLSTAFFNLHSIRLIIAYDDEPASGHEVILCATTNGTTYGGGIRINPWAEPDDGLLASSVVADIKKLKLLIALPLLAIARQKLLREYQGRDCRTVHISTPDRVPVIAQADGEIFSAERFEVGILPGALRVIVPAGHGAASCDATPVPRGCRS